MNKIATYFCICWGFYVFFATMSTILIPPIKKLHPRIIQDWWGHATAMIHASIMSLVAINYWLNVRTDWFVIPETISVYERTGIDIMTGYMIYDTIVETVLVRKINILVLVHHVLGLVSHLCTLYFNSGISAHYTMVVYLAETSTPFLHLCWILEKLNKSDTVLFKMLCGIIIVLFTFFRIIMGPVSIYYCFFIHLEKWNEHLYLMVLQMIIMIGFCALNFYWFYKIIIKNAVSVFTDKKQN